MDLVSMGIDPAAIAYETLLTDYPEVDDRRLLALHDALDGARAHEFPLCPALLAGLSYGAVPAPASQI